MPSRIKISYQRGIIALLVSYLLGYYSRGQPTTIRSSSCSYEKSVTQSALRPSNIPSVEKQNVGNCCTDRDRLQQIVTNSITAENAGGVDGSNPEVSRIHLAQALQWCKKETKLLSKQTTEQMAELGKVLQGRSSGGGGGSSSSSTKATAPHPHWKCVDGAGPRYKVIAERKDVEQSECEALCDEKEFPSCVGFDIEHSCRLYATSRNPRLGVANANGRTWCVRQRATSAQTAQTAADVAAAAAALSSSSTSPPSPPSPAVGTNCPTEWIRVQPSDDARYESEDGPQIRLDGIKQPLDITKKITIEQCKLTSLTGIFRVSKTALCKEGMCVIQCGVPSMSKYISTSNSYVIHFGFSSLGMTFTSDTWVQNWVTTEYGPDEFDFHLEGPELIALDVPSTSIGGVGRTYLGNCVSEMLYNIQIAGKYHVNMVWWRENYISHSENGKGKKEWCVLFVVCCCFFFIK